MSNRRGYQTVRATASCSSRTPLVRGCRLTSSSTMPRIAGRSRTSPGLARYAPSRARTDCSGRLHASAIAKAPRCAASLGLRCRPGCRASVHTRRPRRRCRNPVTSTSVAAQAMRRWAATCWSWWRSTIAYTPVPHLLTRQRWGRPGRGQLSCGPRSTASAPSALSPPTSDPSRVRAPRVGAAPVAAHGELVAGSRRHLPSAAGEDGEPVRAGYRPVKATRQGRARCAGSDRGGPALATRNRSSSSAARQAFLWTPSTAGAPGVRDERRRPVPSPAPERTEKLPR